MSKYLSTEDITESEFLTVVKFIHDDRTDIELRYWPAGTEKASHSRQEEKYWSKRIAEVIGTKCLKDTAEHPWLKQNAEENAWYFEEHELDKVMEYFVILSLAMEP